MITQTYCKIYIAFCLLLSLTLSCRQSFSEQTSITLPSSHSNAIPSPADASLSTSTSTPQPMSIKVSTPQIGIINSPPISYSLPIVMPNLGLTLSDQHVYWVDMESPTAIKRLSLRQPITPEIVAQGTYANGVVSNIEVSGNNEWLVYWERASQYIGGDWKARALNLHTMANYILFDSSGAPFEAEPIPSQAFVTWGMGTDAVVIDYALETNAMDCQRIVTRIIDLATRKDQIIRETDCGRKEAILTRPALTSDKLAAELDHADIDGGGVDIALYNRQTQVLKQLTTDRKSRSPQISDQYVIWERIVPSLNSHYSNSIGIYDLITEQQTIINFPYEFSVPFLYQQWVYWQTGSQPFYLYNLKQNTFILVATTKDCYGVFQWIDMNGNIVAWVRSSGLLEWREIDPEASDPYIGCEEVSV